MSLHFTIMGHIGRGTTRLVALNQHRVSHEDQR